MDCEKKQQKKELAESKARFKKFNDERLKNLKIVNDRKMSEAIKKFNLYINLFYPNKTPNQKKCMKHKLKKNIGLDHNQASFNDVLFRLACEYIGEIKYDISDYENYVYDPNNNRVRDVIDTIYRNKDVGGEYYESQRCSHFKDDFTNNLTNNVKLNDTEKRILFLDYCFKKFR